MVRCRGPSEAVADPVGVAGGFEFVQIVVDQLPVALLDVSWIELELLLRFHVEEYGASVEGEVDFRIVEHMEDDDVVTQMLEVLEPFENFVRVVEQIAD